MVSHWCLFHCEVSRSLSLCVCAMRRHVQLEKMFELSPATAHSIISKMMIYGVRDCPSHPRTCRPRHHTHLRTHTKLTSTHAWAPQA
jgi:hypothetical protein